jgi:threonine dehydrogenase-like Zn-dependent dehydrogenase
VRALRYVGAGVVEWDDIPLPAIADEGQAVVEPVVVASCDLDAALVAGLPMFPPPFTVGHEFVARVVEVGDAVVRFGAGELVVVPFQVSCGTCQRCRKGVTANCTTVPPRSMFGFGEGGGNWGGAMADRVLVPFADHLLVPLPKGVTPAAAASVSDNVPDGWRTVVPHLRRRPDATVLILSESTIGLYAAAAAAALGAGRLTYVDPDEHRRTLAASAGADVLGGPWHRKYPSAEITVNATADLQALHAAIRSTEPGGVCTSIGIYWDDKLPMPMLTMYGLAPTFVTGRANVRGHIPEILELVAAGRMHPEAFTMSTVAWDDAATAWSDLRGKTVFVR